ncbi:hypothetical protein [Sphingomonas sp.]|uniref:hypothetical protein n=1 Tax=Sphingomonas sp. TaxID=28214 RepID=UPI0026138DAE|nr:hypothetical protein [Sphingomonas sp.]
MRLSLALSATMLAVPAVSSTPPPPPKHVWIAGEVLADAAIKEQSRIEPFFAEDVVAFLNGERIASGKEEWLRWWSDDRSHFYGRTFGYSMGRHGSGVLIVVDEHDTRDHSTRPPPAGGPRWTTRSTSYTFGADRLIHAVQIAETDSFLIRPKS